MIAAKFKDVFGSNPSLTHFSPGRVNLIGEHTDYNGGCVLPAALPLGLSLAMRPRTKSQIRLYSDKFETIAERSLDEAAQDHWSDYAVGALQFAQREGLLSGGADIAVETTLPFGAGLSSSAAVVVGLLKMCRDLSGSGIDNIAIARLAREVENNYIGMPCGIMDQMAITIAAPGQALALDTRNLDYECIDLPKDHHMAVIHSGQFRRLSEGRYKVRKEECDAIKDHMGTQDICTLTDDDASGLGDLPATLQRRANHCISEHRRTLTAAAALKSRDMNTLGKLMNQSHVSMRDDFEISLPKIDKLVDNAVQLGAKGARLTGGGFGGCIVACVPHWALENWTANLLEKNPDAFFVC